MGYWTIYLASFAGVLTSSSKPYLERRLDSYPVWRNKSSLIPSININPGMIENTLKMLVESSPAITYRNK